MHVINDVCLIMRRDQTGIFGSPDSCRVFDALILYVQSITFAFRQVDGVMAALSR